jgi:uncharacterized Zn finger protein (UPF0148 family)
MTKDRKIKLIKAKCPNCKASLLIKASVNFCPACRGPLANGQKI